MPQLTVASYAAPYQGPLATPTIYAERECTTFYGATSSLIVHRYVVGVGKLVNLAFAGRDDLPAEVKLPEGIFSIGDFAFNRCPTVTRFSLPESVTQVGHNSFSECTNVESFTVPQRVASIGSRAFAGCNKMQVLTIPDSFASDATSLGDLLFDRCNLISKIVVSNLGSGEQSVVLEEGKWLARNRIVKLLQTVGFEGLAYNLPIPDEWTLANLLDAGYVAYDPQVASRLLQGPKLVDDAFAHKGDMPSNVSFPEGVNISRIGARAFFRCGGITSLKIPNTVTVIEKSAFAGCARLVTFEMPAGVVSIGNRAFLDCRALKTLTIPEGVPLIKDKTFKGCASITTLRIPGAVASIGRSAFAGCASVTALTFARNAHLIIGDNAFSGCSSIAAVTVPAGV